MGGSERSTKYDNFVKVKVVSGDLLEFVNC